MSHKSASVVEEWAEIEPTLDVLSKVGKFAEMSALTSDDIVARLGVVGTPEQCAAEIGRPFGSDAADVPGPA